MTARNVEKQRPSAAIDRRYRKAERSHKDMLEKNSRLATIVALTLALVLPVHADSRTQLKPGWNLFSPQQDVEMGREVSKQAESELPMLNDRQANAYIDALGRQLSAHAPGEK